MIIRPAIPSDLQLARRWLTDARLPVADLTPEHMDGFLIAMLDGRAVGMIGLEQCGQDGLLRSLFVDASDRGRGVARELVDALEQRAKSDQLSQVWLLTIDADRFFAALDYSIVDRADAPDSIRNTVEFSKLCPGDAVLMRKRL